MAAKSTYTKAKYCCFTSWDEKSKPMWNEIHMDYLIYQLEKSPSTNKLHWQGYVEFKTDRMAKKVKDLLEIGLGSHLEKRKGTGTQAADYCKKLDSAVMPLQRFEFGKMQNEGETKRGSRTDLKKQKTILFNIAKKEKH